MRPPLTMCVSCRRATTSSNRQVTGGGLRKERHNNLQSQDFVAIILVPGPRYVLIHSCGFGMESSFRNLSAGPSDCRSAAPLKPSSYIIPTHNPLRSFAASTVTSDGTLRFLLLVWTAELLSLFRWVVSFENQRSVVGRLLIAPARTIAELSLTPTETEPS